MFKVNKNSNFFFLNLKDIYTQMKNDCFTFEKKIIKIMTFNLWHGGEMSNYPLEKTADIILKSGADVVGLQGFFF